MAAPVFVAGAPGNIIAPISLGAGKTAAAFLDLSAALQGRTSCRIVTGSTPPTAGATFSAYEVYGDATQLTITTFTSSTSITVSSAAAMAVGDMILLQRAGATFTAPTLGELATITAISTNTLTVNTLNNTYSASDLVYLINQTPSFTVMPASPTGTFLASTPYSAPLALASGQWCLAAHNGDGSQNVTVALSASKITGFQ